MMRSKTLVALGVMALAVVGGASPAIAKRPTSNTLKLDAYEPNNDGYAGPVRSNVLPTDTRWVAEVQGTVSYYDASWWGWQRKPWPIMCGTPDATGPIFPSRDKDWLKGVGMDAEFVFARPWTAKKCARHPLPSHWSNFQMSRGAGFGHVAPLGAALSAPALDHKYSYPIVGIGRSAEFRLKDAPRTSDNYGALMISVRPAIAADCAGDGYSRFGYADLATCESQIG